MTNESFMEVDVATLPEEVADLFYYLKDVSQLIAATEQTIAMQEVLFMWGCVIGALIIGGILIKTWQKPGKIKRLDMALLAMLAIAGGSYMAKEASFTKHTSYLNALEVEYLEQFELFYNIYQEIDTTETPLSPVFPENTLPSAENPLIDEDALP